MIILSKLGVISPIFLTVLLIAYLMIVELGNEKIKEALRPIVIVLIVIFLIIAIISILATYSRIT